MKKLFFFLVIIFTLIACSKDGKETTETGQITFYRIYNVNNPGQWNLILDGVDKGSLKSTTQMPVCADPGFITLTLSVGTHKYYLKSSIYASGNVKNFSIETGCHQLSCTIN